MTIADQFAITLDENDKRVEFGVVECHRFGEVIDGCCEIGTTNYLDTFVFRRLINRSVVGQHVVVNTFGCLLGVKFTIVAVLVLALEVVNTIGYV